MISFQVYWLKFVGISYIYTYFIPLPSHSPWFGHTQNKWKGTHADFVSFFLFILKEYNLTDITENDIL
jgi:hypothetical protein